MACAPSLDELPAPLRRAFTHELAVLAPNADQRRQLLASFLGCTAELLPAGTLEEFAAQTAGDHTPLSPPFLISELYSMGKNMIFTP